MYHHLKALVAKNAHHLSTHTFSSWLLRKQTFTQTQCRENQTMSLKMYKKMKARVKDSSFHVLKIKQNGFKRSYLQFPALMASQNDQKSFCKGLRESISMRTQKYSASPYLLDWMAFNNEFSAVSDKDAC